MFYIATKFKISDYSVTSDLICLFKTNLYLKLIINKSQNFIFFIIIKNTVIKIKKTHIFSREETNV